MILQSIRTDNRTHWLIRPLIATLVLATASRGALGAVVASDALSYPDGHLGDQNGGVGWTIPWYTASNPDGGWEILSGEVVTTQVPFSSYAGRSFSNPVATPELFIHFDMRTPATVDLNDTIAVYGGSLSNYSIVMGKAPGTSDFAVVGSSLVPTGIAVNPSTTYHVIGVYDTDNHRVVIWINPDGSDYYNPTTGENSGDAMQNVNPSPIGAILLTTYNPDGTQKAGMRFDNFVIADAPGDVGLLSAPPPTPCACLADMNSDGAKDGLDIRNFVNCLINGGDCACANMDALNLVDIADVPLFIGELLNAHPCSDCDNPARCQYSDHLRLVYADRYGDTRVAEGFRVNISGEISQICWNGTYGSVGAPDCSAAAVDDFEIAYYQANGADGRPGTLRAGPFLQSAGALTVSRVLTGIAILGQLEYQFHASHASVAVSANECLWVEITNLGTAACGWEWVSGIAGDNRNYVGAYSGPGAPYAAATQLPFDLSLCIGPAPLEIAPAGCGP